MNFLLHRELGRRELGSAVAGVGAMLPDLWRMAERSIRARPRAVAEDDLERGVVHHLEADRWFHASEVFLRGERATAAALGGIGVAKLGRFGHIAWELCLDGAMLRARDFEAELRHLRADLQAVDEVALVALAERHGAAGLDAAARSRFHLRMGRIVEALGEGSWIEGYRHGAGLTARLEGLRLRLGLEPLAEGMRPLVAAALEERLAAASEALPRLLALRRVHREDVA